MTWFRLNGPSVAVSTKANSLPATAPLRRVIGIHFRRPAARGHELTEPLSVEKQLPGRNLENGCKLVDGRWRQRPLRAFPSGHVTLVNPEQRGQLDLGEPRAFP